MQIIVNAVPERRKMIQHLKTLLPNIEVIWDTDYRGSWWGLDQACRLATEDTLFLQDDALPCENFINLVDSAVSLRPGTQIQFWGLYSQWVLPCEKKNVTWIKWVHGGSGVAQFIPFVHIKEFLYWANKNTEFTRKNSDLRLAIWRTLNQLPSWLTFPELVQHIGEVSSLRTGRHKPIGEKFISDTNMIFNNLFHVSKWDISTYATNFLISNGKNGHVLPDFRASLSKLKDSM